MYYDYGNNKDYNCNTSNCSEHVWEIEGVDVHNPHQSNVTRIQPGTYGVLTITFVNKQSGMRQVGTACSNHPDENAASMLCQHFGHHSGKWEEVHVDNHEFDLRYLNEAAFWCFMCFLLLAYKIVHIMINL